MPSIPQIQCRFNIEKFRRQTLDAKRSPVAGRSRITVVTKAGLPIKVAKERYRAIIQHLMNAVFELAVPGVAVLIEERFRFEPQLIPVGAEPSLAVPAQFVIWSVAPPLQLVEKHVPENRVFSHR